jgi:hypothetical protein
VRYVSNGTYNSSASAEDDDIRGEPPINDAALNAVAARVRVAADELKENDII